MKKKILFRADGNSTTGLGHIYRLIALFEITKGAFDTIFVTKESTTLQIIPENIHIQVIPEGISIEEEPKWITEHFSSNEYIIIADGYQFNSNYQRKIKTNGFRMIYIDDLAGEHMFANAVLNHSLALSQSDFSKETDTKLYLGTKYALLRPAFLKITKEAKLINKIDTAFVCFGGADPLNLTEKATRALLNNLQIRNVHIVLGGAYKRESILKLQTSNPNKVKIWRNVSENKLIEIMSSCNFAIVPASTILYELCCVKMPVLSGFFVDNQELIYKGFLEKKAIYGGGNFCAFEEGDFENWIELVLSKDDYNQQMESQKELFDDQIATRHSNLINEICSD